MNENEILNNLGRDSNGTPTAPIIGSVPDPDQAAFKQRQMQFHEWNDLWIDIREAQKAWIDRYKALPPSYKAFCGQDENQHNLAVRIALSKAYLIYLTEDE